MVLPSSFLVLLSLQTYCITCHGQLPYNVNYPALVPQASYAYGSPYRYAQTAYTPMGNYVSRAGYTWNAQIRNAVSKAFPGYHTPYKKYSSYGGSYTRWRTPVARQRAAIPMGYDVWPQAVTPVEDAGMRWEMEKVGSSRICSPGPPLEGNPRLKNCLIIGDSISLGYLPAVKRALQGHCQVQHAPFAKASGAVDSNYGLKCLSMMLSTTALGPTKYDAIVFNFGMHDIDFSGKFHEEYVALPDYKQNLQELKRRLLESGAALAFALTTPVPSDVSKNAKVQEYNRVARSVMEEDGRVDVIDLYSLVGKMCGNPPYKTCRFMKKPGDVHYNPKGSNILGREIAEALQRLLYRSHPRGSINTPHMPNVPELYFREGLASYSVQNDSSLCPDMLTRCPSDTTCCESLMSLTGYGCCMLPQAVRCPDNWHCCPLGQTCSPDCNFRSCRCMRFVPKQEHVMQNDEAIAVKVQKEHQAPNRGGGKSKGAHGNSESGGKQTQLQKGGYKGGKSTNPGQGMITAKVGHGDSSKGKKEKGSNKNGANTPPGMRGKAKVAPSVTRHGTLHRTAKMKPHLNVGHQRRPSFGHFTNSTAGVKSRNTAKDANLKQSENKKPLSITDELEHLIKKHRSRSFPHTQHSKIIIPAPAGERKDEQGGTKIRTEGPEKKQPTSAAIRTRIRPKGYDGERKTTMPQRVSNSIRHIGPPGVRGTSKGERTHTWRALRKQALSNGNKPRLKLGFKSKDVFDIAREHRKKKSEQTVVKGVWQTGNGGVSYKSKEQRSGRISTETHHSGSAWSSYGFSSGEVRASGEGTNDEKQTDGNVHFAHSGTSGIHDNESGKPQSGEYSFSYHHEKDEEFGGESGDGFRYSHRKEERIELPDTQTAGSGPEFGSGIWKLLLSGEGDKTTRPDKDELLESGHDAESGFYETRLREHSYPSGHGSTDVLAHSLRIKKPEEVLSIHAGDSGSTPFQETREWHFKSPQFKNANVFGEESDGSVGYRTKHEQRQNGFREDSSTEETSSSSDILRGKKNQHGVDSTEEGKPFISGEDAGAGSTLQLSLSAHGSDTSTFGGGTELNGGEAVKSNGHQDEISSGQYRFGYHRTTSAENTKSIPSAKLSSLSEKPESRHESYSDEDAMSTNSADGNSVAANKAYWHESLQDQHGHWKGMRSAEDSRNNFNQGKSEEEDDNNSGLTARTAYSDGGRADSRELSNDLINRTRASKAFGKSSSKYVNPVHSKSVEKVLLNALSRDHLGVRHRGSSAHQGDSSVAERETNPNVTSNNKTAQGFFTETNHETATERKSSRHRWIRAKELQSRLSSGISSLDQPYEEGSEEYDDWSSDDDDFVSSSDSEDVDDDVDDDDIWGSEDGPFL